MTAKIYTQFTFQYGEIKREIGVDIDEGEFNLHSSMERLKVI